MNFVVCLKSKYNMRKFAKLKMEQLAEYIKTIPSKKLEDCMISSKGRLLERGMLIHVSIVLSLQDRQTLHCVQYKQ